MIRVKLTLTYLGIFLSAMLMTSPLTSQDVRLHNPSFEDTPRRGTLNPVTGQRSKPIVGWKDCGAIEFPDATPPDIHKGNSGFWENNVPTADGKTYMTIVVREDDSYESVSQKMIGTLKADQCYRFSIQLVMSKQYLSATKSNQNTLSNFTNPAVLRVYGGSYACESAELLGESNPVTNTTWQEYEFDIRPSQDYGYVTLQAFFVTPVLAGYNGHVCVDNASMFREVDCDAPVEVLAEAKPKVKKKPVPSFKKPKKKEPVDTYTRESRENKVDTIVHVRPKKKLIKELDIRTLAIGMQINLPHLYFGADASAISTDSYTVLNELYDFLDQYEEVNIEVGGHTNNKPPHEYCDKLSTDRAQAVAKYLISKGIGEERVTFKGYGKRRPITNNDTPEGRKKNQRVQIKITSLG